MTYIGVLLLPRRPMVTIRENVSLAPYTYFKIGGPARFFTEAHSEEELREALTFAKEKSVPFWILGGGSNVLIADEGLPGLAIRMLFDGIEFTRLNLVRVGAGVTMARAVAASVEAGLAGFEWAIGIPGTIGGSVRGNAGCFGGEMKDVIEGVEVLQTTNDKLQMTNKFQISNVNCRFSYRESEFKRDPSLTILSATLKLQKGNPEESRKLIAQYARERAVKQDIGMQCAGCMFKNPFPDKPAGMLIDTAGCKGMRVGNAIVSEKHANYFVNRGGASANEVRALTAMIKKRVRDAHDIELEEEIQYLPRRQAGLP